MAQSPSSQPNRPTANVVIATIKTNPILHSQFLNRLKESLQQALVPFFGFAGRWLDIPNKSTRNRQLLCNDEGVSFIEVYMDRTLHSMVNSLAEFQPAPKLQGFELLGLDPTQVKQEMLYSSK
ncbi:unnamed protein product [Calypogeia fissa]